MILLTVAMFAALGVFIFAFAAIAVWLTHAPPGASGLRTWLTSRRATRELMCSFCQSRLRTDGDFCSDHCRDANAEWSRDWQAHS